MILVSTVSARMRMCQAFEATIQVWTRMEGAKGEQGSDGDTIKDGEEWKREPG